VTNRREKSKNGCGGGRASGWDECKIKVYEVSLQRISGIKISFVAFGKLELGILAAG
jgi:hypothetical protein